MIPTSNLLRYLEFYLWDHYKPYPIFWNLKININDVPEFCVCDEFLPFFKHKKGHQHQQKNLIVFLHFYIFLMI